MVCAVVMLLKKKKELQFKLQKSDFRLNAQCRKFLAIGLPLALQEFLTQMSFLALCAFVNRLGLEASSGYGVASKIVNFAMLIPSALMQSMASFVSQNIGAGNKKRARQSMLTGIGVGLAFGCAVFALVWCKGDVLCSAFTTEAGVIASGFAYLKGFAPETIATAVLFSMVGYFNGNDKTVWVMVQGLIQNEQNGRCGTAEPPPAVQVRVSGAAGARGGRLPLGRGRTFALHGAPSLFCVAASWYAPRAAIVRGTQVWYTIAE